MKFFEYLMVQVGITMAVYFLITAPHIGYVFFDWGIRYTNGALYACSLLSYAVGMVSTIKINKKWK